MLRYDTRTDLLNAIAERYDYRTYLEIGVKHYENFNAIRIPEKIAVDPVYGKTFKVTSDQFFKETKWLYPEFDLIFVDGDHRMEPCSRDILNAWLHMAPGGLIVVHDVWPKVIDLIGERQEGRKGWCGDVWLAYLLALQNGFSGYTIDCETGCGIITGFGATPTKIPDRITFDAFLEHAEEWLNVKEEIE